MSMGAALGHWVACPLKEISRSPGVRVCNRESDIDKGLGSLEVEHQIDLPRGRKRISKPMKPVRIPLYGFPDVVLHADELSVKRHPQYQAAKKGDVDAADLLVAEL